MSSIDRRKAYHIDPLNGQQNVLAIRTPSSRRSGGAYRQGYRGHNYPNRLKVWTSAQVRCITLQMKRTSLRRANDSFKSGPHPMSRNYLSVAKAIGSMPLFNVSMLLRRFERAFCVPDHGLLDFLRDSSKRLVRSVDSRRSAHHSSSS
jgi:hypothetical protein